mmetsp:Transcript_6715/g.11020  ORF Transcript_6715/g.11020 Transcript_6715/m.11020 type:complete len:311 (+) Transcript_6715:51-983(+)
MSRFRKKKAAESCSLADMVALNETSAYEALQLHKSKISRLRVAGKYDEALTLTTQAATLQLQQKYENSGNELAILFVDIMTESKLALTPEIRNLVNEIANSFESVPSLGAPFLKDCISLTATLGPRQLGDAILHRQLAGKLWRLKAAEKDESGQDEGDEFRVTAVLHFAMGEAPEALWQQIIEEPSMDPAVAPWTGQTRREQVVALGVLHFLALENLRDAHVLFRLLKKHRNEHKIEKESLLFEFTDRLLLTSVRDARQLFQQLVKAYQAQLTYHPAALQLLEGPIAKKLFGIQAPPNIMSMISNMFGGA